MALAASIANFISLRVSLQRETVIKLCIYVLLVLTEWTFFKVLSLYKLVEVDVLELSAKQNLPLFLLELGLLQLLVLNPLRINVYLIGIVDSLCLLTLHFYDLLQLHLVVLGQVTHMPVERRSWKCKWVTLLLLRVIEVDILDYQLAMKLDIKGLTIHWRVSTEVSFN